MGTRSVTIFMDGNGELCRVYRQYDGYPEGMGVDLAKACNRKITNGIAYGGPDRAKYKTYEAYQKARLAGYKTANGMGELAVLALLKLKTDAGNVYLTAPNGPVSDWAEYIYRVTGKEGEYPKISCETHVDDEGPSMFNPKAGDRCVFPPMGPQEIIEKYSEKAA